MKVIWRRFVVCRRMCGSCVQSPHHFILIEGVWTSVNFCLQGGSWNQSSERTPELLSTLPFTGNSRKWAALTARQGQSWACDPIPSVPVDTLHTTCATPTAFPLPAVSLPVPCPRCREPSPLLSTRSLEAGGPLPTAPSFLGPAESWGSGRFPRSGAPLLAPERLPKWLKTPGWWKEQPFNKSSPCKVTTWVSRSPSFFISFWHGKNVLK